MRVHKRARARAHTRTHTHTHWPAGPGRLTSGEDGHHEVGAQHVAPADVGLGEPAGPEQAVDEALRVGLELEAPEAAGAAVEGDGDEAAGFEGAEEDWGEVEADEEAAPDGGDAEEAEELEGADGLDCAGEGDLLGVAAAATAGGGGGTAAVGELDGPVDPAEGYAGDEVEPEAGRGAEVSAGDLGEVVDVGAAREDDADEEAVGEVEEEEDVDGHVEGEERAGGADVVGGPEGELERDDDDGADEEQDADGLVVGVEEGGGVDQFGAFDSAAGLALLDAK